MIPSSPGQPRPWLLLLLPLALAAAASAQRVSRAHADGSTHWYEAVPVPAGIDWPAASQAAAAAGGYLATLTSPEETAFVFGLVDSPQYWSQRTPGGVWDGPWLGGVQQTGTSEPGGGWEWAELEPLAYTAWAANQPDDSQRADRIHFGGSTVGRTATWADDPRTLRLPGFVIEYSGPTTPGTVGLTLRRPESFDGYNLIAPLQSNRAWLIDPRGRVVQAWSGLPLAGACTELLANGNLLRTGRTDNPAFEFAGGAGGVVQEIDWAGNRVWEFTHSGPTWILHHDFERLPNGNTILMAWELKTRAEAIAAGRDPALLGTELWPEKLIEVNPAGQIVWEWHAWDHLVQDHDSTKGNFGDVAGSPERIDLNFAANANADWMHANAVAYNPALDQVMLSVLLFNELVVLDHSTTTAEAAGRVGGHSGKGGDLLYRWGNPAAYRAGTAADQRLFRQHDTHWIPPGLPGAGNILVFNNGLAPRRWSTVDEVVPPPVDAQGNYPRTGAAWGPGQALWSYADTPPGAFYSAIISGAQRLPNGNTMVCGGAIGLLREVEPTGRTVWEYAVGGPVLQGSAAALQTVFRSPRYAPGFAGLAGRNLTPQDPIETYATALLADGSRVDHHAAPGQSVSLSLVAARDAGLIYLAATTFTPGTIPVDYRVLRVGFDPLLGASVGNVFPSVFRDYVGILDAQGRARATLAVPALGELVGVDFHSTFVTLDPAARSGIRTLANDVVVGVRQ